MTNRATNHPTNPIDAWHHCEKKIRILLVISSPIDDSSRVSPIRELEEIYRQLDFARVPAAIMKLNPPTLHYLRSTLTSCQFDIVHFIGHARPDALQLEKDDGTSDWVSIDDMANLFEETRVKLVVLNNCSSESIADNLIIRKVPAIISTSNRIHSETSLLLSATIYSSIFRGRTPKETISVVNRSIKKDALSHHQETIVAIGPRSNSPIFTDLTDWGEPEFYPCIPKNNLPPLSRDIFYDRVDESLKVYDGLTRSSLASPFIGITGISGSGKSAVALSTAWRYAWRFPKGITYISLRQKPFNLGASFQHLNWPIEDTPPNNILDAIIYELSQGQYLLILDDMESADSDEISTITKLLQSWDTSLGGRALLIMRQKRTELDSLVQSNWIPIGDLPDDASIDLFQFHVGGKEFAKNKLGDDLFKIPELCYRHPKLIQATASALISGKPWKEVETRLSNLIGDPAERSIEMLEKTIDQIQEETPLVIHFLDSWSVFAEVTSENAWRYVIRGQKLDTNDSMWILQGDALEMMQRATILERFEISGEVICKMHPLVSEYLHKRRWQNLSFEKQRRYEDAHLNYYIETCSSTKSDEYPIIREWGNILLAMERAQKHHKWKELETLCNALVGNDFYQLVKKGPWDYAKKALDFGIEATEHTENQKLRITFLTNSGAINYRLSEYENAENSYKKALELAQSLNDPDSEVDALKGLGQIYYRAGNYDLAETNYMEGLNLAQTHHSDKRIADIQHQLGKVAYRKHETQRAEELFLATLDTRQRIGDKRGISKTLHEIGRVKHATQQYDDAERLYKQSLALREEVNDPVGQQATLHQLGLLAFDQGNYAVAQTYYEDSMRLSQALNDRMWIAHNLFRQGRLLWRLSQETEARQSVSEAFDICQRLGIGLKAEVSRWLESPY